MIFARAANKNRRCLPRPGGLFRRFRQPDAAMPHTGTNISRLERPVKSRTAIRGLEGDPRPCAGPQTSCCGVRQRRVPHRRARI